MTDTRKETEEILNSILPPRCWDEDGQMWTQTVSSVPATRQDVINLQEMLDTRLQQTQARETGICPVRRDLYTQCFGQYMRIFEDSCYFSLCHVSAQRINTYMQCVFNLNIDMVSLRRRNHPAGDHQLHRARPSVAAHSRRDRHVHGGIRNAVLQLGGVWATQGVAGARGQRVAARKGRCARGTYMSSILYEFLHTPRLIFKCTNLYYFVRI